MAELQKWSGDGRLHLETDELVFRGAQRLAIPLTSITSVSDDNGWLLVEHDGERSRFDLGKLTPSWVNAIANPRSRLDKLDVKQGMHTGIVGGLDEDFVLELQGRATVDTEPGDAVDLMFVRVQMSDELEVLTAIRVRIKPAGAIWVVHPKGPSGVKHELIAEAARTAGLVDIKSARFSHTHSALKLVIPRDQR